MIDIAHLERIAAAGAEKCVVTRRYLRQVAKELAAGRLAQERLARFESCQGNTL